MQKHNLPGEITTLNDKMLIFIMMVIVFSSCRTLLVQQDTNKIFNTEKLIYNTSSKDAKYSVSLVSNYILKISDDKDSFFLVPYKIKTSENNNYYCFDFPYGNPKWDYKNMFLRKGRIINIENIKKQKVLLAYAQVKNEQFYKAMLNSSDTSQKQLFEFGFLLKEGIKKVEVTPDNLITFTTIVPD
jgi:hypothetical protein